MFSNSRMCTHSTLYSATSLEGSPFLPFALFLSVKIHTKASSTWPVHSNASLAARSSIP